MDQTAHSVETGIDQYIAGRQNTGQFLTFAIGDETYAIEILQVREILRYETLTKVPGVPISIRGVMNLRGSVVPVVDLAAKFSGEASEITKWSCVIIIDVQLDSESSVIGIVADSVKQVIDLGPEEIEPPPSFGPKIKVEYLKGMGKTGRKFVLILDIEKTLNTDELLAAALLHSQGGSNADIRQAENTAENDTNKADEGA